MLVNIERHHQVEPERKENSCFTPSIYVLNINSLAKPHAIQHLRADVLSIGPDVVVLTESKLNRNHTDEEFGIPGYLCYRRDRSQLKSNGKPRGGGGLVTYVSVKYQSSIYNQKMEDLRIE